MTQTNTQETNWSLVRTQDDNYIIGNVTQLGDNGLLMSPAFFILTDALIRTEDLVNIAITGLPKNLEVSDDIKWSLPVPAIMVANFKWMMEMTPEAFKEIRDNFSNNSSG